MKKDNLIFDKLMKSVLNRYRPSELREKDFSKLYYLYEKEYGTAKNWMSFYKLLRKKHARKLLESEKNKYGLTEKILREESTKLKKLKGQYGSLTYYSIVYALIHNLAKKESSLFEIGYGERPLIIKKLNTEGYKCTGIEPEPKQADGKIAFKSKISNLPKSIKKEQDIVFANLVFCASYMNYFKKKFKWERKNRDKLLSMLADLLKGGGYLILVDDIGSFFTKKQLMKHFDVLIHEKDIFLASEKANPFFALTLCKKKRFKI